MWKCPKCKREFKNENQSHYCGKPKTVDEYIANQPDEIQPMLRSVREAIRKAIPEAAERISWQMPTFWRGENLIHFAVHKNHIGVYPGAEAMTHFSTRLAGYKTGKGAIRFPYGTLDKEHLALIAEIAEWCGKQL